jgi:ATP-dependent RNA helicase HelY
LSTTSFVLDAYQRVAIDHLDAGRSVIVCAPTGAGKTVVAEHAIRRSLAAGATSVYTTPLKALSNQKRADLARTFGVTVGLMTGDRVEHPDASIVVMTTEVLRALLLSRAPITDRIDTVVLDEFHWIQDPQRGGTWEEVVIAAAPSTTLVCLSATLPGASIVHEWMVHVHGPTSLVEETSRPVDLTLLYALGNPRRDPPALVPMFDGDKPNPTAELLDGVRLRRADDSPLRRRERDRNRTVTPERLDLIDAMLRENKLPAIWFLLSRAGCDLAVAECVERKVRLTTVDEAHELRRLAHDAAAHIPDDDRRALGFDGWVDALALGVAAHHGGVSPIQRELVEIAFARELVKVVFATETLAVGVNLPARSVVIDRVQRKQRHGGELLTVAEFAQLSGRAGRRGIDDAGFVVVPWSADVSFAQVTALAKGRLPTLASHFAPTPASVANFARNRGPRELQTFVRSSLRGYLAQRHVAALQADLGALTESLADAGALDGTPAPAITCDITLDHLMPGDVVVDPGRPSTGACAVVAPVRTRRGQHAIDVVGHDGRRTTVTARMFRASPVIVGHIELPPIAASPRGFTRSVVDLLHAAALATALPAPPPAPTARAEERRQLRDRDAVTTLRARIEHAEHELDDELSAHVALLRRRGHLDGWQPTASGVALSRLFHDAGLLVAEALRASLFDGLSAAELAAFVSGFTPRGSRAEHGDRAPTPKVAAAYRAAEVLVRELNAAQDDLDLVHTPAPNATLAGVVYRWADTGNLGHALRGSDVLPGDLVREVRQVAELIEQIGSVSVEPLCGVCAEAVARLNRGIVVDEVQRVNT